MTSLFDMVKETDLRLDFTDALKSPTAYEGLERSGSGPGCSCVCTASALTPGYNVWRVFIRV